MTINEEWKAIAGYEGWYEVSNCGRVRRVRAACSTKVGLILKPAPMPKYLGVRLYRNNKPENRSVHVLVAEAFHGERKTGMQVNHKNGNRLDNRSDNLEWMTASENTLHAVRTGLMRVRVGEEHSQSKLTESIVKHIRSLVAGGASQASLARRFGVSVMAIHKIVHRRTWSHVGVAV